MTAATAMVGCGGDDGGSGGSASGGGGSASTDSTGTGGTGTGGTSSFPCSPEDAACTKVTSGCIALADNKDQNVFALRMAQLTVTKPAGLASGVIKTVVENGVLMNLTKCNLNGQGSFSLLLQFDKAANKVTIGGALPATDPTVGYKFVSGTYQNLAVAPIQTDATIDASGKFTPTGVDLNLPIFLAASDTAPSIILPLHKASVAGTLSDNNNCIGKYNAATLDPQNLCEPSETSRAFTDGADLDAYMTLEEADGVIVTALQQSLCVIISGDPLTYGDGKMPAKCKRTNTKIDFQGDWCAGTNTAASAGCTDATKLQGSLAASAVTTLP
jgi:hypothetical protein